MKYCIKCGHQLDDNAKFCTVCGTRQPDSSSHHESIVDVDPYPFRNQPDDAPYSDEQDHSQYSDQQSSSHYTYEQDHSQDAYQHNGPQYGANGPQHDTYDAYGPYHDPYNTYEPDPVRTDSNSKGLVIVGYLLGWIGFFIVLLAGDRNDPYLNFHLNQILVIDLFELLGFIPILGWIWAVVMFVFWLLTFIGACQGKMKPAPLIGNIHILDK